MRRRRNSWSCRAKKSENEGGHEAFNHQPGVRDIRIRNPGAGIKQQPKRHAKNTKQRASWKENSERFFAAHAEKLRPRVLVDLMRHLTLRTFRSRFDRRQLSYPVCVPTRRVAGPRRRLRA